MSFTTIYIFKVIHYNKLNIIFLVLTILFPKCNEISTLFLLLDIISNYNFYPFISAQFYSTKNDLLRKAQKIKKNSFKICLTCRLFLQNGPSPSLSGSSRPQTMKELMQGVIERTLMKTHSAAAPNPAQVLFLNIIPLSCILYIYLLLFKKNSSNIFMSSNIFLNITNFHYYI